MTMSLFPATGWLTRSQLAGLALAAVLLGACQSGFTIEASQSMQPGSVTAAPFGYIDFCTRQPEECRAAASAPHKVTLTARRWEELNRINAEVNRAIIPATDAELYRTYEFWTYPVNRGDCEDYVLLKRQRLMALGWPETALLISVALEPDGRAHALLIAVTDRGDYVLDNQSPAILPWTQTPYLWDKRQSTVDPLVWVSLRPNRLSQAATAATRRVPKRGPAKNRKGK